MDRAAWLAKRRETMPDGGPRIQASELPTILWGDQTELYLDKIGMGEDFDSLLLRRGRAWEQAVAEEYASQTGRPVGNLGAFVIQQHPKLEWMGATLDRVTAGSICSPDPFGLATTEREMISDRYDAQHVGAPLQIKVAIGRADDWEFGPPRSVLTQVQAEVACYDVPWGACAALVNYYKPLVVADVKRDDEFLALCLPDVEEFRDRVRRRIPPEPRDPERAIPALKRLFGRGSGDTLDLRADPDVLPLVVSWEQAQADEKAAEDRKQEAHAKLLRRMDGATWARLEGGSYLRLQPWGSGTRLVREWPGRAS